MVVGILKWQKRLTKATIFSQNGLENTRGRDTKIKLCFVIFVAWVKRTTLTRHLSLREHQDATIEA